MKNTLSLSLGLQWPIIRLPFFLSLFLSLACSRVVLHLCICIFVFIDRLRPNEHIPGPRNGAKKCDEFYEFWISFWIKSCEKTVEYTNIQLEDVCATMMANDVPMQTYNHITISKSMPSSHYFITLICGDLIT